MHLPFWELILYTIVNNPCTLFIALFFLAFVLLLFIALLVSLMK